MQAGPYKHPDPQTIEVPLEITYRICEYCGGSYPDNRLRCPDCQAPNPHPILRPRPATIIWRDPYV